MLVDFPPWLQTALTLAAVLFVIAHEVGRSMLRRDPRSVWGARLIVLGVGLRALRRSPAGRFIPPIARAFIDSLSDSDRPPPRSGA